MLSRFALPAVPLPPDRVLSRRPRLAMTSQGTAHGRSAGAIQQRNLWAASRSAESALVSEALSRRTSGARVTPKRGGWGDSEAPSRQSCRTATYASSRSRPHRSPTRRSPTARRCASEVSSYPRVHDRPRKPPAARPQWVINRDARGARCPPIESRPPAPTGDDESRDDTQTLRPRDPAAEPLGRRGFLARDRQPLHSRTRSPISACSLSRTRRARARRGGSPGAATSPSPSGPASRPRTRSR